MATMSNEEICGELEALVKAIKVTDSNKKVTIAGLKAIDKAVRDKLVEIALAYNQYIQIGSEHVVLKDEYSTYGYIPGQWISSSDEC